MNEAQITFGFRSVLTSSSSSIPHRVYTHERHTRPTNMKYFIYIFTIPPPPPPYRRTKYFWHSRTSYLLQLLFFWQFNSKPWNRFFVFSSWIRYNPTAEIINKHPRLELSPILQRVGQVDTPHQAAPSTVRPQLLLGRYRYSGMWSAQCKADVWRPRRTWPENLFSTTRKKQEIDIHGIRPKLFIPSSSLIVPLPLRGRWGFDKYKLKCKQVVYVGGGGCLGLD